MLSMLTLLGLCHKQHTNLSGPDLKESRRKVSWERAIEQKRERGRERERERERERGPLSQWWHQDAGISAWQLAPGMGSQRPQQLPAFSDLWLYDKWRLHFTICNPPVCVSRQYRARPDTGRPISDFNLVPLRRAYLPLMTANWYKPETGRALIDLFSLRSCFDLHLIQICTLSTFIWTHIV